MKKSVTCILPGTTGGAERMTVFIAKMLKEANYNVRLVIVDHSKGNIENFIPSNITVDYLLCKHIPFCVYPLLKFVKRQSPDKLFCSIGHLSPWVLLVGRLLGIPVIIRNDLGIDGLSRSIIKLRSITYRWADKIISQQEEMKEEYIKTLGLKPDKMVVLHNPVDIQLIKQKTEGLKSPYPSNDNINYLFVGRFHYDKGQDVLVRAFLELIKKNKNANLYLVGAFNENDSFYKQVRVLANKACDKIHFIGFDPNPYIWMKYADCYVMPSRREGLPNSLIEAMALNVPVVATNCLAIIERIIDNGCNGFIVEKENVELMMEAMLKAVKLENVSTNYQGAKAEDFVRLF